MSTFMANKGNIVRKWYVLDAAGKPLGKTAAAAANLLRGKLKPEYTPHTDCGDFVIIINAEKAVLTGKKLEQKYYRTHSGWIGGLKEVQYSTLMRERPELAMKLAVRGMMPRNVISKDSMSRLKIYRGGEHEHAAQKPELWAL
ncbi:50S ribosomal protein L13 [Lawsonibacter asaccharolyticus]|uniref:50S ribosomal protein L13 n=1 Tax=Lawsonibacter asaccharolyticus TaxID=2108523 RepID=UPI002657AB66|nr:50S ribosomal protein L13 [Lawsonibacter asaccharolyticus]UMM46628.1 50S ribosomal protein L13 [Lawsonibacter asaccharolyticus]